jgi:hypothetical protein
MAVWGCAAVSSMEDGGHKVDEASNPSGFGVGAEAVPEMRQHQCKGFVGARMG